MVSFPARAASSRAEATRPSIVVPGFNSRSPVRLREWPSLSALVAVLLLLAVLAAACTSGDATPVGDERAVVESTITRYDRLLGEGYRSMDMTQMRQVTDQLQAEDLYIHMSALGEGGVRLLPTLRSLELLDVSIEATSATATTRELWDYRHEDRVTREIVFIQRGQSYELVWDLVRRSDGAWLVSDVRAIEATSTSPPERLGTPMPGTEAF